MKTHLSRPILLLTLFLLLGGIAIVLTPPARAAATAGGTFVVDSTADTNAKDGLLTFREAILLANGGTGPDGLNRALDSNERAQLQGCAFSGSPNNWLITDGCGLGKLDTIRFNLPGAGVHTISVTDHKGLPHLTDPVIIDGYSQPGASKNTLAKGDNAVLLIQLSPAAGIGDIAGLELDTNSSTIQGLIVSGFQDYFIQGYGIVVAGQNNTIQGNFIGTDANGAASLLNSFGIWVSSGSNLIGGVSPADRNLISGNGGGIYISGPGAAQNKIQGNFIGTTRSGTGALPNGSAIIIDGASQTLIGGTIHGARNIISGNDSSIGISAGSNNTKIQGSFIGVQVNGKQPLGNQSGIGVVGASTLIGGAAKGAGNRIAYNGTAGITVYNLNTALDNTFSRNSIYANALGIDLGADGIPPNDIGIPADEDTGPNNLQNSPIIMKAIATTKTIKVYLDSTVNTTYTIELFSAPACDGSGSAQGKTFLGASKITTDQYGDATKSIVVTKTFKPNQGTVGTATDPFGNTSEFGYCKTAK